ncbi:MULTISPECIES: YceI family protein [Asticcacaulis]|uniref:YceI family protein n=1 Tax=Asticcacaulis TaxID=76890 RepID=UPI001AE3B8D1|nr:MULTISPECIES: YceI family protein [Asticcacaulis]MBP2161101.1 polyisoprenoid-binding protein YceI [Asticcacaulis solisilvae]MDR6802146.1 polyisoprenoid-binding protein YceI [Asticcacaulis sp. BE141]
MNAIKSLLAASAVALAFAGTAAFAAPVTYNIEPTHTSVTFFWGHGGGLSRMNGKFMNAVGTVVLDEAAPATSKVEVSFAIDGINTGVAALDGHLKTPDFFDAAQFPTATFKSTKVEVTGAKTAKVTGDLTLHGVTKPVTLDVTLNKIADDKKKAGFNARGTIKRSDFGISRFIPAVSDEIDLEISSELNLPK